MVLGAPDLSLTGTFSIEFNDTDAAISRVVSVTENDVTIEVEEGPFLTVAATSAQLTIGEFELSGDFYFEKKETADEQEVITVLAQDVDFDLGSDLGDLVSITDGSGSFIITDDGLAGVGSVTLDLGVPDVGLAGTFNLRINTLEVAVDETVEIGGVSVPISVPPGPYLRLSSNDLTLTVLGLNITGDFTVEQKQTQDGDEVVTIEAKDVRFDFGTDLVELTNGEALFILVNGGMAGRGRIDVSVSAFGESFEQPFTWDFNNTGQSVDEFIPNDESSVDGTGFGPLAVDDVLDELNLPAGPYNRLSSEGPVSFQIDGPTGPLAVTAEIVLTLVDDSPDYVTVGVSGLSTLLTAGPVSLSISGGPPARGSSSRGRPRRRRS